MAKWRQTLLMCTLGLFVLSGCDNYRESATTAPPKELLLYCGATMANAMREVSNQFEKQENCVVKIISGGSGYMLRCIQINQVGDFYLPGQESFMQQCINADLISSSKVIGCNRAAMMVARNNPRRITPDLSNFTNGKYRTILGNRKSGSIGRETYNLLQPLGMYDAAIKQTMYIAVDTQDMVQSIAEGKADLALCWQASIASYDDSNAVEILPIADTSVPSHQLILGTLKCVHLPELAQRYIDFVLSRQGKEILRRFALDPECRP